MLDLTCHWSHFNPTGDFLVRLVKLRKLPGKVESDLRTITTKFFIQKNELLCCCICLLCPKLNSSISMFVKFSNIHVLYGCNIVVLENPFYCHRFKMKSHKNLKTKLKKKIKKYCFFQLELGQTDCLVLSTISIPSIPAIV